MGSAARRPHRRARPPAAAEDHRTADERPAAFGEIRRKRSAAPGESAELSRHILTTSPDVAVSTNLGPWMNRRGVFDRHSREDVFRPHGAGQRASIGAARPEGQHIELGIAEQKLFLLLGAAGLSHDLTGARILPIGTVYDPFVNRGHDALSYACYQDARFLLVSTPSGISLAPEGGQHQATNTPLLGIVQDRCRLRARPIATSWRFCSATPSRTCKLPRGAPCGCGSRRICCSSPKTLNEKKM